jgi:hypothetical protein
MQEPSRRRRSPRQAALAPILRSVNDLCGSSAGDGSPAPPLSLEGRQTPTGDTRPTHLDADGAATLWCGEHTAAENRGLPTTPFPLWRRGIVAPTKLGRCEVPFQTASARAMPMKIGPVAAHLDRTLSSPPSPNAHCVSGLEIAYRRSQTSRSATRGICCRRVARPKWPWPKGPIASVAARV